MKADRQVDRNEPQHLAAMVDCDSRFRPVCGIAKLERMLQQYVADALGLPVGCVRPSTRFVEDLDLSILSALKLVLSLEALLDVQLPDPEVAQVNCVKDFLDVLSNTVFSFAERRSDN